MSDQQAPTEHAMSEAHEDVLRSPGAQSQRPIGSVVGQRRPSGDAGRSGILSPGAQSRGLKSPEMAARSVISKAPSRGPSRGGMSPVDAYMPATEFQSFAMPGPPEPPAAAMSQSQRPPSQQRPQSSRAPSQRLPPTHRESSELGTIPNEATGHDAYLDENGYSYVPRGTSTRGPSQYGWEKESESGSYTHEPTTAYTTTTPAPAQRRMPPTVSGTSQAGASQMGTSYDRNHRRMPSDEPRMSRHKTPVQAPMQALSPVPSAPHTLRTQAEDGGLPCQ